MSLKSDQNSSTFTMGKERKEEKSEGFDILLDKLGFGRWTIIMFLTYILWASFIPYFSMGGAFYNPTVDHWCQVDELDATNWTLEQKMDFSIPWEDRGGERVRSQCWMYDKDYSMVKNDHWNNSDEGNSLTNRVSCRKWKYDSSIFEDTVTMEWDLVCNENGWSPMYQSLYFIGIAVGEPLIGILADRFGRRFILRGTSLIFTLVAATSALVPTYNLVLTARFILGMLHASIGVGFVYAMEACPPKFRTISGLYMTVPFAFTGLAFGIVAYFVRSWRTLQLICTIPSLVAVFFIPFMDESPRWQILRGQAENAKKTLEKAAKWHRVHISEEEINKVIFEEQLRAKRQIDNSVDFYEEGGKGEGSFVTKVLRLLLIWTGGFFTLVRTPVLRRITLAMFVCWFATGVTYWGMSLSGTTYSSDPFIYMILSSLVEVPGYLGFLPFVSRFGRKRILSLNFAICSASILTILIVPQQCTWVIFVLALTGKLFITGGYNILYLFTSELFPTCVRAKGLNISSMMARIGSIVSPFIIRTLATTYWWAPSLAFGCAAAFGSVGALLLPESTGKPLSETVEQVEILYGSSSSSSVSLSSAKKERGQEQSSDNSFV